MPSRPNIEKILSSLEDVQPAEPQPFFVTRVIQRLHNSNDVTPSFSWSRFALAVSVIILLVVMNLVLFFSPVRSLDQAVRDWKSTTPEWVVEYTENPGTSIYDQPSNK